MKLSSVAKLAAASLVAGMAFTFTGTPADAQTIPIRIAVIDTEANVSQVQYRRYRRGGSRYRSYRRGGSRYGSYRRGGSRYGSYRRGGSRYGSYRQYRRSYRGGSRYGSYRPYRRSYRRGFHGPSFGFGIGLGLAAPLLAAPFTGAYAHPYSYGTSYRLAPGSAAWIQYCSQKYRSFDPASGTYLAYSGVRRPCQVP